MCQHTYSYLIRIDNWSSIRTSSYYTSRQTQLWCIGKRWHFHYSIASTSTRRRSLICWLFSVVSRRSRWSFTAEQRTLSYWIDRMRLIGCIGWLLTISLLLSDTHCLLCQLTIRIDIAIVTQCRCCRRRICVRMLQLHLLLLSNDTSLKQNQLINLHKYQLFR